MLLEMRLNGKNTLTCFSGLDRAAFEAIAGDVPLRLSLSGFTIGMKSANPLLISQRGWDHLAIPKPKKSGQFSLTRCVDLTNGTLNTGQYAISLQNEWHAGVNVEVFSRLKRYIVATPSLSGWTQHRT